MKLELWEQKLDKEDSISLKISLILSLVKTSTRIQELVQEHLSSLKKDFLSYFPDLSLLDAKLIRNPLTVDASSVPVDIQEEFVELINDYTATDAMRLFP